METLNAAVKFIPVDQLKPNPWNRTVFDPQAIEEIAESAKVGGIREPLLVRPLAEGGYQIASGHRRWLAAQKAGLKEVPCLIQAMTDEQVAQDNITLNVQREQIPPLELARMVNTYLNDFKVTQEQAARLFGKSRTWVTELVGFLSMHPDLRANVSVLTLGYRALQILKRLSQELQAQVAQELKEGKLKPEDIEKRCNQLRFGKGNQGRDPHSIPEDPYASLWSKVKGKLEGCAESWAVTYTSFGFGGKKEPGWAFGLINEDITPQRIATWLKLVAQGIEEADLPGPATAIRERDQKEEERMRKLIEKQEDMNRKLAETSKAVVEQAVKDKRLDPEVAKYLTPAEGEARQGRPAKPGRSPEVQRKIDEIKAKFGRIL